MESRGGVKKMTPHQGFLAQEEKKGVGRGEWVCENEGRFLEGHLLR